MKKIAFLVGFVFLMASLYPQNVSDFDVQGNDDGTMTIMNYKGTAKDIVIPEKIFNLPVSRLNHAAFQNKGLTSVVIPKTVSKIGNDVFAQNQLVSVTIPESVIFIGNSAFEGNRLTSISLPGNLEYIGNSTFASNQLSSVTLICNYSRKRINN